LSFFVGFVFFVVKFGYSVEWLRSKNACRNFKKLLFSAPSARSAVNLHFFEVSSVTGRKI